MRQHSSDKRIRRIRAQYRKRIAIVAIIMLIIGLVLGIVADRMLFKGKDTPAAPSVTAEITPTPAPIDEPAEDDEGDLGTFGDDIDVEPEGTEPEPEGGEGEDYTIAMEAPTAEPTATPEPTAEPTATPEPTPEPTATPVPGPTVIATVPFGESYTFSTQIKSDGTARITADESEPFETVNFTMTMKDYMLPSDFAQKWGNVYKLQGTEAGAGFDLTLNNYTGSATIIPQNIIKIAFRGESGETENLGFQLMDAEIAGNPEVSVKNGETKTLWKRYTFSNSGEEMKYLAVTTYNSGAIETILFELVSDVAPTPDPKEQYSTLSRGTKSDAVLDLQKRLIDLGYLSGTADGNFGGKTQDAVRAAQKMFGMEETGTATPEFQAALFADDAKSSGSGESEAN